MGSPPSRVEISGSILKILNAKLNEHVSENINLNFQCPICRKKTSTFKKFNKTFVRFVQQNTKIKNLKILDNVAKEFNELLEYKIMNMTVVDVLIFLNMSPQLKKIYGKYVNILKIVMKTKKEMDEQWNRYYNTCQELKNLNNSLQDVVEEIKCASSNNNLNLENISAV